MRAGIVVPGIATPGPRDRAWIDGFAWRPDPIRAMGAASSHARAI